MTEKMCEVQFRQKEKGSPLTTPSTVINDKK